MTLAGAATPNAEGVDTGHRDPGQTGVEGALGEFERALAEFCEAHAHEPSAIDLAIDTYLVAGDFE